MWANCSSLITPAPNQSWSLAGAYCFLTKPNLFITAVFNVLTILLFVPACALIAHHGLRERRRGSSAAVNHMDYFTYHMVVMELLGCVGGALMLYATIQADLLPLMASLFLISLTWHGEMFFNMLTCVERYLAVVHPITYLSLRNERWVQVRDAVTVGVWLMSILGMCLVAKDKVSTVKSFCIMVLFLVVTSFCSLSALLTLTRSGPEGRERVDRSKVRALHTMVAILGVLVGRFGAGLIWSAVYLDMNHYCLMRSLGLWLNLPCSLIIPVLYLKRNGKFPFSKKRRGG